MVPLEELHTSTAQVGESVVKHLLVVLRDEESPKKSYLQFVDVVFNM